MQLISIVGALTALTALADATSCNLSSMNAVLTSTDAIKCSKDSGYSMTSLSTPTGSEMTLMCTSSACQSVIKELKTISPTECTLGTFALYANLITPLSSLCLGVQTTTSSDSSSTSQSLANSTTDSVRIDSSSSTGGSSSGYASGWGSWEIGGVATGAAVLMLVLVGMFMIRKRRRSHEQSSTSPEISDPSTTKQVQVLESGHSLADGRDQYSQASSGSGPDRTTSSTNLWQDPVIVAARISIDRLKLGALIGRGGFGEVYRGKYRDQIVAVKTLLPEKRKDLTQIRAFLSEIRLMATMEHPHIVQFIGVAWESLSDLYCGMDASKVDIVYQVAYALTYLHSLEPVVLHRDLKARNILMTESLNAKITTSARSDETMTAGVGSWMWMAPYSLGVVLSELDTHELPYFHTNGNSLPDAAMMQMVIRGELRVHFSRFMGPDMTQFAERCASLKPHERPTAAEVLYYFQVARNR